MLLSFGGKHCVPCRGMIPHERELQARLAERPFTLVGFDRSDSEEAEDLKAFLRREDVTWPVFPGWAGDVDVFRRWNVHAIPVFFLIMTSG